MRVEQGWVDLSREAGVVLTIGIFDGVHLGHRRLISGVVRQARARGWCSLVLTFHPHPRAVLAPDRWEGYLCPLEERVSQIASLGPDRMLILRFSAELAAMPAAEFLEELLRHVPVRELHVGFDFALGRGREGDVHLLRRWGKERGLVVRPVPPVRLQGQIVSSTRIRELVRQGQMQEAARRLGRPFALAGQVIPGAGRGRELGFPTANLRLDPRQVLPADGVYAVRVYLPAALQEVYQPGRGPLSGMAYVGRRPTFGPGERGVEVHLFDFAADLLGCDLRVEFVECLRPDRTFPGPEALVSQMHRDAGHARELLSG